MVDGVGHPLAVLTTAANVNEGTKLPRLLSAIVPIAQPDGKPPRRYPDKLHADKAYDSQKNRDELEKRGILQRIASYPRVNGSTKNKDAKAKKEPKPKLGRYRWKIERTISWLHRFRRLRIRDERQGRLHRAFLLIACSLINWRMLCKAA